ncbi:hypothetical protein [Hugenholtzia roseola]|uniref:hypothetical protein n=1 Tax=Hugenholtzia roseola TaxID=1002 RepID=UPI00041255C8|nr:hypothetical protein [Hugenholtzia roseola]
MDKQKMEQVMKRAARYFSLSKKDYIYASFSGELYLPEQRQAAIETHGEEKIFAIARTEVLDYIEDALYF